jgi:hypothetical protein
MGWTIGWGSRKELIAHLTRTEENEVRVFETLKKFTSGNDLWTVQQATVKATGEKQTFIVLYMMTTGREGWGYKDVEESMGPYKYSCPLSFLELAPEPQRPEGYHDWRAGVRTYHARRNQKLTVGQEIKLTNGQTYKVSRLGKGKIYASQNGVEYRVPRRMLTTTIISVPSNDNA